MAEMANPARMAEAMPLATGLLLLLQTVRISYREERQKLEGMGTAAVAAAAVAAVTSAPVVPVDVAMVEDRMADEAEMAVVVAREAQEDRGEGLRLPFTEMNLIQGQYC